MKQWIAMMSGVMGLLMSSMVCAQVDLPTDLKASPKVANKSGIYIGVGLGYGKNRLNGVSKNQGFALLVNAGYKISPNIAIELGYLRFAKNVSFIGTSSNSNGYYLAVKPIIPINESIETFLKIGALLANTNITAGIPIVNRNRVVLLTGLGFAYNINPSIAITAETIITVTSGSFPTTLNGFVGAAYKLPL